MLYKYNEHNTQAADDDAIFTFIFHEFFFFFYLWLLFLLLWIIASVTSILFFSSKLPLLCFILMSQKMCTYFVHGFSGYFSVLCIYIFLRFSQDRIDKLTVINSSSWQAVTVRTAVVEPLLNDDLKITLLSLR